MTKRGGGGERDGSALKTAMVVLGGLGLAWLTMETAFKPFLDRFRDAIDRSDPARDPDDDEVGAEEESKKGGDLPSSD